MKKYIEALSIIDEAIKVEPREPYFYKIKAETFLLIL